MTQKKPEVLNLSVREDEDLDYKIRAMKKKLVGAIHRANYNLLDEEILRISRELDELILRSIDTE